MGKRASLERSDSNLLKPVLKLKLNKNSLL
jgi:hypothetical protein